jgi:hypothetical protein
MLKRASMLLLAAGLSTSAISDDYVARARGGDMVRLTQQPCPAEILAFVPPDFHAHMQAAFAVIDGKQYRACWLLRPDGQVVVQYADGDGGLVPVEHFKPEAGI